MRGGTRSAPGLSEKTGVVYLMVRVRPKAASNDVAGEHAGALKVRVTAPPEKGKANRAVIELLAERLGIGRSSVTLVRGEGSRDKLFAIKGMKKEAIAKVLFGW